jgi:hypothetical protein
MFILKVCYTVINKKIIFSHYATIPQIITILFLTFIIDHFFCKFKISKKNLLIRIEIK